MCALVRLSEGTRAQQQGCGALLLLPLAIPTSAPLFNYAVAALISASFVAS